MSCFTAKRLHLFLDLSCHLNVLCLPQEFCFRSDERCNLCRLLATSSLNYLATKVISAVTVTNMQDFLRVIASARANNILVPVSPTNKFCSDYPGKCAVNIGTGLRQKLGQAVAAYAGSLLQNPPRGRLIMHNECNGCAPGNKHTANTQQALLHAENASCLDSLLIFCG